MEENLSSNNTDPTACLYSSHIRDHSPRIGLRDLLSRHLTSKREVYLHHSLSSMTQPFSIAWYSVQFWENRQWFPLYLLTWIYHVTTKMQVPPCLPGMLKCLWESLTTNCMGGHLIQVAKVFQTGLLCKLSQSLCPLISSILVNNFIFSVYCLHCPCCEVKYFMSLLRSGYPNKV